MSAVYVPTLRFKALAKALSEIEPCPFAGRVTADQIKLVLGEVGDVWPISILADADLAEPAVIVAQ